jgi:hypothetical protein
VAIPREVAEAAGAVVKSFLPAFCSSVSPKGDKGVQEARSALENLVDNVAMAPCETPIDPNLIDMAQEPPPQSMTCVMKRPASKICLTSYGRD